jgi:hypothetical protein
MSRVIGRHSCCAEDSRPHCKIASETDRRPWFAAYVQTYMERDFRQLNAVSSVPDFRS